MNYSTCSDINDADIAFRPALPVIFKIAKLFEQLDRDGNKIKFELDQHNFQYSRIASSRNSSVQVLHADFSPATTPCPAIPGSVFYVQDDPWVNYLEYYKKFSFFPLSCIYFPEGGLLHLIETSPDASLYNLKHNEDVLPGK